MLYNIPEKKNLIKKELFPFFKEIGFNNKVHTNRNIRFYKKINNADYAFIDCRILSGPFLEFSAIKIHFSEIEKLLFGIGIQNFSGDYFVDIGKPGVKVTLIEDTSPIHSKELTNIDDLKEFCYQIKNYVLDVCLKFIEEYKKLEKIYSEVKSLKPGGDFWKTKLFPSEESIFRATIILKKFDDPDFLNYVQWFREFIVKNFRTPDKWLASFEYLLKILQNQR